MSAEAMIERFNEVRQPAGQASGRIDAVLQHGWIFFRKIRAKPPWKIVLASAGAVLFLGFMIPYLWLLKEFEGIHGVFAIAVGQQVYGLVRHRFGKITSGVAGVAAWILSIVLCDVNLVLGSLVLTAGVLGNGAGFVRRVSQDVPRATDLFGVGPESGRIHAYNSWGPAGDMPVVDVDYFLVYRGMPPTADIQGCLYAVEDDGLALHLAEHILDYPNHEYMLKMLGHICQKPVLLLDEIDRSGDEWQNRLAVVRAPKNKWQLTGLDRDAILRMSRNVYEPGDSVA